MISTKTKMLLPLLLWVMQLAGWAGEINLKAIDAKINGTGAEYESQEDRQCIGHWSDVKTWISWDVDITSPGKVDVYLSQAIPYEFAGSSYEVHIGDEVLKGRIAIGSGWGEFDEIKVGSVTILKKGKYSVKLKPLKMATKRAFANIRGIILRGGQKLGQLYKKPPAKFLPVNIGQSGLIDNNCAIFYPEGYDKTKHSKSFALLNEPIIDAQLPSSWQLKPQFYKTEENSRFTLEIPEGTSLYGTGEVMGNLERKGTKTTLWNTDNFCYSKDGGKRLYQSHPWIMGVRKDGSAFGVLADTTWRSDIELKKSIKFTSEAPEFRVLIIESATPQALMKRLGELTGTIKLPPMWALGFQQCRWSYKTDKRVREIADGFRSRKIPCDVIWMDIDYMDGFRVFTFSKENFPNPSSTNRYLHDNNFKSIWMIDPGVKVDKNYSVYQSGSKKDVWVQTKDGKEFNGKVWPGMCAFPDYTRPETCKWWAELYKSFMNLGIDGVWNDMNEPAVFGGPDHSMPVDNWHRGGGNILPGSHSQYHNVYGMLMVKATREGILAAKPDKRPFVLTRSNYLGGQRYAATWTGDNASNWHHLKVSIPMSLTLGLSGQPFSGPDIGGFAGNAEGDLWAHWIAVGAFYPFSRAHACSGTKPKEPWAFGPEVEKVARVALERRYRLMPYLYTLFQESTQNGMPVMRPAFFADPSDLSLRKEEQLFLLGKDLLIVPKWAKKPVKPKGFTKVVNLVGENSKTDKYQCDIIIRDGAIVPLTKVMQSTTEYDHSELTLLIRLNEAGSATGVLYEDKNDGFGYQNGEFRKTEFTAKKVGDKIIVSSKISGNLDISTRNIKFEVITDHKSVKKTIKESTKMTIQL